MADVVYSKPTLWKRIVRGTLDIVAAILLVAALLSSFVSHIVLNGEVYKKIVFTDIFDESIEKNVYEALDSIYSIIDISSDKIVSSIGIDPLIVYEHEYTNQFIDAMVSNSPFEPESFNNDKLRDIISAEIESMGVTVSDEDFESICATVITKLNATLQYIPKLVTDRIGSVSKFFNKFNVLSKFEIPLYMAFILFALTNFLFGGKSHIKNVFFGLSSACWIAVITVTIPLCMIFAYDFPSRLALETSTLKWLIVGINNVVFKTSSTIFTIISVVLSVILVISCYVKVVFVKKNEKKHFYRANFDEDFSEEISESASE